MTGHVPGGVGALGVGSGSEKYCHFHIRATSAIISFMDDFINAPVTVGELTAALANYPPDKKLKVLYVRESEESSGDGNMKYWPGKIIYGGQT